MVTAREFVLVDAKGERQAMLKVRRGGEVALELGYDGGNPQIEMAAKGVGPYINLFGGPGAARISLVSIPSEGSSVFLRDGAGGERLTLKVDARGWPLLTTYDDRGRDRLLLGGGTGDEDSHGLEIVGPGGKTEVALNVFGKNGSNLTFLDPATGDGRIQLGVMMLDAERSQSRAYVEVFDSKGQVRSLVPGKVGD